MGVDSPDPQRHSIRTASALFVGAGLISLCNSLLGTMPQVDVGLLRLNSLVAIALGIVVLALPWHRWPSRAPFVLCVVGLVLLVGADRLHHYSRTDEALVVYPVFFVMVCAWAGLSQSRGVPLMLAPLLGAGLATMLVDGGHGQAALAAAVVTIPAAALLGEVVAWAIAQLQRAAERDGRRRAALDALVVGTTKLQHAVMPHEARQIVCDCAREAFDASHVTFTDESRHEVCYDAPTRTLTVPLRGQTGVLGTLRAEVTFERADSFLLDLARLFGGQVGTRLEQLRVIESLSGAATTDVLTGVGNRRRAEQLLARLEPGDLVVLLDLDNFKAVNDEDGHQAGDALLATLGEFLRMHLRPGDEVARYGGDELIIVVHRANDFTVSSLAPRLVAGWRERRPRTTFSLGVAVRHDDEPSDHTLRRADMALYRAKSGGRDRWCVAEEPWRAQAALSAHHG
jgi:diguanylate cyclase (GGDEF)-like protein